MSHTEATRKDKVRQMWKIKIDGKWNYRVDKAFGYKNFATVTHPSILRLH
jgi:hypothetical protein